MNSVQDLIQLEDKIQQAPGLVVLFGGQSCNVCQVIKPQLESLIAQHFPKLEMLYIDCQDATQICAQNAIFSLPVVKVYFDGQCFVEKARSFSLNALMNEIQRPYDMMFED